MIQSRHIFHSLRIFPDKLFLSEFEYMKLILSDDIQLKGYNTFHYSLMERKSCIMSLLVLEMNYQT